MSSNPVISDIERLRSTQLPTGELVPVHSQVGPDSGRVIAHAIEVAKPKLACEVGLAFGMSTLYILDAMQRFGDGRLIGLDPAQHDKTWRGGGLHNVRRAGFSHRYQFIEEASQIALPRLASEGTRIQFGFIDGWHTFDHTLVDFFYIDLMLDVGGVVVLDDTGYPAIRRLCQFIVTNRAYVVLDVDAQPQARTLRRKVKKTMQTMLHSLVRDNFTPSAEARELQSPVDGTQLVAFKKVGLDTRSFDHFVAF